MTDDHLDRDQYLELLHTSGHGAEATEWSLLWELLDDREGWHFERPSPDPAWCFGLLGACTIAISARPEGLLVYEHSADRETWFTSIGDLRRWLEHNEPEPTLTPLQQRILDDLLPDEIERWKADQDPDTA